MQHLLFSSFLAEKRNTKVPTLLLEQVGDAQGMASGIQSLFYDLGYCALTEMRRASGQRVNVAGLDRRGQFAIAEMKVSRADLQSDHKW